MRRLISVLAVGMLMVLFIVMARAQGPTGTAGRIEPGTTFYVPKNAPHQFLNVGKTPYDVVVVMLK